MPLVLYEKKDKIAYITLNRPEKLNALSPDLINELAKIWVDFRDDDDVWVGIFTGAGVGSVTVAGSWARSGLSAWIKASDACARSASISTRVANPMADSWERSRQSSGMVCVRLVAAPTMETFV